MTFVITDYLSDARERTTWQFEGLPVFDKHIQLLLNEKIILINVIADLYNNRTLENAVGENLDNIGRIIGVSRFVPDIEILKYFAFQGYPNGEGFVDVVLPTTGKFYTLGQRVTGNSPLNDDDYRKLLKARIIKNTAKGKVDDIILSINTLVPLTTGMGHEVIEITSGSDYPAFVIKLDRDMSDVEERLVLGRKVDGTSDTLIPKAAGVTMMVMDSNGVYIT